MSGGQVIGTIISGITVIALTYVIVSRSAAFSQVSGGGVTAFGKINKTFQQP